MSGDFETLLGATGRLRPIGDDSWRSVEEWAGSALPDDYKDLISEYGEGVIFRHLFLPHPDGGDPLLKFAREEREAFRLERNSMPRPLPLEIDWDRVFPWAYSDWNGDQCLLLPSRVDDSWRVAVSYRQCPEVEVVAVSVTEFIKRLLSGVKIPRGWPTEGLPWESLRESRLI